ncbi:MAG TPA: Ig-like domain-containing protein [Flavipsychrobacter sp.]|nr:Ig-like domain-containing protein [Flavipsychrobacter sp.]
MAPTGGQKDVTPPKLLEVTPADSLLSTRVTRLSLRFDEFITVANAAREVTISPILPFPLDVGFNRKTVTVKVPDSLLQSNTTYRIAFGNAIKDLHENNPFTGYSYIFSTGSYFDSLSLSGYVINAATGLKDSGALIVLHDAAKSNSAVVRDRPLYAVKADNAGNFRFDGLPEKVFKLYAIRDANNNMIYDGVGEMIAFLDTVVVPSSTPLPMQMNIFAEADSAGNVAGTVEETPMRGKSRQTAESNATDGFTYIAAIDTSDVKKRTVDVTQPIQINFNKPVVTFNSNRINLSYDSAGVSVEANVVRTEDTFRKNVLLLNSKWQENTVYTLRLLKGFAQDSAGTDAMPSRYTFRTRRDEDYAKLHVHLPTKYYSKGFVFVLLKGNDTFYQRSVTDTMIHFTRLQPATYTMRVIVDKNKNGQWDTGDLLDGLQPEEVIPYLNPIMLKPGWENMIDFEEEKKPKPDRSTDKTDKLRR